MHPRASARACRRASRIAIQPQRGRPRAHVADGRLGRLLHDVAELAGQDQLALAATMDTSVTSKSPPWAVTAARVTPTRRVSAVWR